MSSYLSFYANDKVLGFVSGYSAHLSVIHIIKVKIYRTPLVIRSRKYTIVYMAE